MPLFISSLNSGSNGNCYYVGNHQEAVLIDAGISCRETEKRMQQVGLDMQKVRAVFISHEHTDHISGLTVLAKKYQLPVYITENTLKFSQLPIASHLIMPLRAEEEIQIGSLQVSAFSKHHDASDPHSFMVSCEGVKVGVFTDIGIVCDNLVHHFRQCHAAFLESNYDAEMLEQGRYPYFLKSRIRNGKGHLSNHQALQLCMDHRPAFMTHLLLSHLSKENNCPDLVTQLFRKHMNNMEITVASRYGPTPLYTIHAQANLPVPAPLFIRNRKMKHRTAQLSLF